MGSPHINSTQNGVHNLADTPEDVQIRPDLSRHERADRAPDLGRARSQDAPHLGRASAEGGGRRRPLTSAHRSLPLEPSVARDFIGCSRLGNVRPNVFPPLKTIISSNRDIAAKYAYRTNPRDFQIAITYHNH